MAFGFFTSLLISTAFYVIGELLRPKPDFEDAEAIPYEDANFPSVDPSKKQPVIWGRVDLFSPHVMDMLDYYQVAIRKKVKTGLFSSSKVTVGYRYFVTMQLGLCNEIDTLHGIYVDNRVVGFSGGSGSDVNGYTYTVSQPSFLGGKQNGGGLIGTFVFYRGVSAQLPNSTIGGYRNPNPAYRWTSYILLNNFEIGESPNMDSWGFDVSRYPDPLGLGATTNKIGDDINPMSIVVELFTNDDYGYGLSLSDLDTSIFTAVAGVLKSEGNGMSLKWVRNESVEKIIQTVNKQVDGVARYNPTTGLWEYKLIREDYTVGNLTVLDETNIKKLVHFSRASWDETINQIELNYSQRGTKEKPAPAMADDNSNFVRQGRQKILTVNHPGCYSSTLANQLAAREQRANGFALASAEFVADQSVFGLLPGDPFVLNWSQLGISQIVMRVGDVGFGTDDQLELSLSCLEDIFKLASATFVTPPASGFTEIVQTPQAITTYHATDTPYVFALSDETQDQTALLDTAMGMAVPPQSNSISYDLQARQGADSFIDEDEGFHLPSGTLQAALADDTVDTVASIVIENVSLAAAINQTTVNDDNIKRGFENLILVISTVNDPFAQLGAGTKYLAEFMAYESASVVGSEVTLNNVHRGMIDTLPAEFNLGDRVWFLSGIDIDGPTKTATKLLDAETIDVRFVNQASTGEASASASTTVTARDRVNRPYTGGNFQLNSERYPSSAVALGGDVTVTWAHRNRLSDELRYQDDPNQAYATGVPENGFEYVLDIFDASGLAGNSHLRRVVKTGSSIGAGGASILQYGFEDADRDQYIYTNTLQTVDGGPYTEYRFELKVADATESTDSLLSVIRTIDVTVNYADGSTPSNLSFSQTAEVDYFDPQPTEMIETDETFTDTSTGRFTRYTEGTQGTFTISGGIATIEHVTGSDHNDIIVTGNAIDMPQAMVAIDVLSHSSSSGSYDNIGVGIAKDQDNFIWAGYDRIAGQVRLQAKIAGVNNFFASVSRTLTLPCKLALSIIANSAVIWLDEGSGWEVVTSGDVSSYVNLKTTTLTDWYGGWTQATPNSASGSTWTFDNLQIGRFGTVGVRDFTPVTNEDGSVVIDGSTVQLLTTAVDSRGVGYQAVYTYDFESRAFVSHDAVIMVDRGSATQNDLAGHIIKYGNGDRRLIITTWGNGFGGVLDILHKLETTVDLLSGSHIVSGMTVLNLDVPVAAEGVYDSMLLKDGATWYLAYTITDDVDFVGDPFYASCDSSTDLSTWTNVGNDSANQGFEGTKLVDIGGTWYVTAGTGTSVRSYVMTTMAFDSTLNLTTSGEGNTQPHAPIFKFGFTYFCISFDGTKYGASNFTWGDLRQYEAAVVPA